MTTTKLSSESAAQGTETDRSPQRPGTSIVARAVALGLAAAVIQAVMLIAFAWPAVRIAPREVPIAVAGPQAAAVAQLLTDHETGAFDIRTVADESAAQAAIEHRDVYGAIVTGEQPRVLVASAASPMVTQLLSAVASQLAGTPVVAARDVVAADPHDPRGIGFGAMVLPLVMSGLAAGVLLTLVIPTVAGRAVGLVTFAIAGGLLSMSIVQGWLHLLPGDYLTMASIGALISFSVAGTVAGLAAAIGRAGLGLGAVTLLLIGNPFSAATSAPELLPRPWGTIGQLLPPGAAATLLRSVAFFGDAPISTPLTVLLCWAAAALALLGIGFLRTRRPAPRPVGDPAAA